VGRLTDSIQEADDKANAIANAVFKANERKDQFMLTMNWNQEELEQWALAAKQKEEDNLALQRCVRAAYFRYPLSPLTPPFLSPPPQVHARRRGEDQGRNFAD